jgi:hypothetical protein
MDRFKLVFPPMKSAAAETAFRAAGEVDGHETAGSETVAGLMTRREKPVRSVRRQRRDRSLWPRRW